MSKTNYDISKQMQNDLIKAYCQSCPGSWTMQEACEKAVKLPAPRFYVTAKQAYQVISRMMKGDFRRVNKLKPLRKKMYYELFDVTVKLSESWQHAGKKLWSIMPFAVIHPASEFFISPHTLYCIRQEIRTGRIDDEGRGRTHDYQGKRKRKRHEKRRRANQPEGN